MFEKDMRISYLLDFYGNVLDERCARIMEAYYEDDLSLAEIAEGEAISRQGVRHIIKKGEEQLSFFEERLGLASHYRELTTVAARLTALADTMKRQNNTDAAALLSEAANAILNKG